MANEDRLYQCSPSRCGEWKPASEFYWRSPGRRNPWCKVCYHDWYASRYVLKSSASSRDERVCAHCEKQYRPKQRKRSWYCSRECKEAARYAAAAADLAASKPARWCMHCAYPLAQGKRADAIFCSPQCNSRAHALQRKLRARGGPVGEPGYLRAFVCERDRWRCGICREPVDRALQHPDPMCASLDHLKPVSEGGTNDLWNLRLTHLVCNLRRRDCAYGEMVPLF